MGGGAVAGAPAVIASVGLGSCVALTIYDPYRRIGGLAHVMLPDSAKILKEGSTVQFPYHYADTAVQALMEELRNHGASRRGLVAKLAGGAKMFNSCESDVAGIGKRNVDSLMGVLRVHHIPLVGWDIDGNCGRCVEFHLGSGDLVVTIAGREKIVI